MAYNYLPEDPINSSQDRCSLRLFFFDENELEQNYYLKTIKIKNDLEIFNDNKIIDLLIKAGAKIDLQDNYGSTAFMTASRNGRDKVVDYLIKAGLKIDFKNKK